jgi:predicted acyl esterase
MTAAIAGVTIAIVLVPAGGTHASTLAVFSVRGSVNQVDVTHAPPGDTLELVNAAGAAVATGTVDSLGSLLFRNVDAGDGYTVEDGDAVSLPIDVMAATDTPPQIFYDTQQLVDGFQYITTRDGTRLSAEVTLPGPIDGGPYPTVIEYSGYDPSHPGAPQPSTQIAQLLGYATVGVNIRGTGCSGGAFDFFEPLQGLDGYDVVETVAAQPWVLAHRPGMVGISYPGIAQTFVAPTRPPHLAAIAALSVVADTYRSLADPGGIPNVGFPREWAQERDDAAKPYGQGWERSVVDAGGPNGVQCAENQLMRHQNANLVDEFDAHPFREPVAVADALSPALLAPNIGVPVFMGGAWQDEQTGGQSSPIWPNLTGVPAGKLKVFGTNGTHADSLVAELDRWYEFLEFYVAHRVPHISPTLRAIAPALFQVAIGVGGVHLPPDRFDNTKSYDSQLAKYESEAPVRIMFENGAGDSSNLGAPIGRYEMHFPSWPPPNVAPTAWYFQPDQKLASAPPTVADDAGDASTSYVYDPPAKPATDFHGSTSDIWAAHPAFDWRTLPLGKALAFDSTPLPSTIVTAGPGSVNLWLRSTAPDTDLEVTLSELRPDGQELYVQNGWLRASHRALDPSSTVLEPVHPDTSASAAPLPAGQFSAARVALFPFAHIFRAGSRLRITVEAPGGNRPFWAFADLAASGTVVNEIAHSAGRASDLVLPVIPNPPAGIPAQYPPCGALRGEPCRAVVSNGAPTHVRAAPNGTDATVTWTAAAPRAGDRVGGYHVTEQPGGRTLDVSGTATSAVFHDLAPGVHHFDVTVTFSVSHASVAATGSPDVTIVDEPPSSTTTTTTTTTSTAPTTTTTVATTATTIVTPTESSTTMTTLAGAQNTPAVDSGAAVAGSTLPRTGGSAGPLAFLGALALAVGAALTPGRRRRGLP